MWRIVQALRWSQRWRTSTRTRRRPRRPRRSRRPTTTPTRRRRPWTPTIPAASATAASATKSPRASCKVRAKAGPPGDAPHRPGSSRRACAARLGVAVDERRAVPQGRRPREEDRHGQVEQVQHRHRHQADHRRAQQLHAPQVYVLGRPPSCASVWRRGLTGWLDIARGGPGPQRSRRI